MPAPRIAIVAPTPVGFILGQQLQAGLSQATLWTKATHPLPKSVEHIKVYSTSLAQTVEQLWHEVDRLVFVFACGAVVRLIAPFLQNKHSDPGVVVVDEAGRHAIALCGSHSGGADDLARQVAALMGGTAVLTAASDAHHLPALDVLGDPFGWRRGSGDWLALASAAANGSPIAIRQTCGTQLWHRQLPTNHPYQFAGTADTHPDATAQLWISDRVDPPDTSLPTACWHPRTLWVGIGCERHTAAETINTAIEQALANAGLAIESIAGLASIDIKQDEVGLLSVANQRHWPIRWFTASELAAQAVPHPSDIVARAIGTPSVAEAAALLATTGTPEAKPPALTVSKQVHRTSDSGSCTVAIARAEQEFSSRPGKLWLVGIGPGSLAQITPAAKAALAQVDVIIGYQRYVTYIRPLLVPQQIVETSPITQEVQRADRAIALARRGLSVAVISSGDCGIYGMAGLVLERLARDNWDGHTPDVEVCPGITALQAAAARVGAPLMHDFCAISLSDLLTPWPTIEQRLTAAAAADFVVALYNPRSRTRITPFERALDIFRQYRSSHTPVAIAQSVYRPDESIQQTTLANLTIEQVDMLTLILIGNASTFVHQNHLVTPRGYHPSSKTSS